MTGSDLARLRDIGPTYDPGNFGTPAVAVSPDGQRIAFQLRRADPERNSYCTGIFVFDLTTKIFTRIAEGGELITWRGSNFAFVDFPIGDPAQISPKWSPDGRWVAFLKRDNGKTQVWRVTWDGAHAEQVTKASEDVDDFVWTASGDAIVHATRPGLNAAERDRQTEALRGYHYDDRMNPSMGITPMTIGPIANDYKIVEIASGISRAASSDEAALLKPSSTVLAAVSVNSNTGGEPASAWIAASNKPAGDELALFWKHADGHSEKCSYEACAGRLIGLWRSEYPGEVIFMRREGWARSDTALYRWRIGGGAPVRILVTPDILASCQLLKDRLICLHEASTIPRRIVGVDLRSGRIDEVFQPNPEFAAFRLGSVERLKWRNDVGLETIGDLVLPPDHQPGQKHPLIVVQYITRGFLRGGTGDEYPIFWLAANGYAVLSFQRPQDYAGITPPSDKSAFQKAETAGWTDRRSVQSSLEKGIELVLSRGVADRAKIGLTGLSDGASTAAFGIINSDLFAAASLSTCCVDRITLLLAGRATSAVFENRLGYPKFTDPAEAFWNPTTLLENPERVPPLLLQLAESEYLHGIATYTALRDHHRPVDMFVFPGEYHIKWQPAHRLAIYNRNLAWFDFWLNGVERSDLVNISEIERWKAMRGRP